MSLIAAALLVILLLTIAIGLFSLKKINQPKSQKQIDNEQNKLRKNVVKMKEELVAWQNYSFRDITSAMIYEHFDGDQERLKGTLYATDKKPIIVFDRVEKGIRTNGFLYAASTDFDVFFYIRANDFMIEYNEELLGTIKNNGEIIDPKGKVIGHAEHPPKISFDIAGYKHRAGNENFSLHLYGRELANIWVAPNYSDPDSPKNLAAIFEENKWGIPVLELLDKPSEADEKWLNALGILEVAYHGHWLV